MSKIKKYKKSVRTRGMVRSGSSGSDSGYIKTSPKSEMDWPVSLGAVVAEGTIDGFGKWALDDAGLLVIDGKGEMPDREDQIAASIFAPADFTEPWSQRGKVGAIKQDYMSIKQVYISDGVTSIGKSAFYNCMGLTSVHIPDGVISIGNNAFTRCWNLASIHIPDGVTSIGDWAFDGCVSLSSICIPDSIISIGNGAFGYCSSLTSLRIPDGVTSIGERAFEFCCSLTSIHIPDSVISIGFGACLFCDKLRQVTMPKRFGDQPLFNRYYGIPRSIVTFI